MRNSESPTGAVDSHSALHDGRAAGAERKQDMSNGWYCEL